MRASSRPPCRGSARADLALAHRRPSRPARTNGLATPSITTRRSVCRPEAMTRSPSAIPPNVTGLATTLLSASDRQHDLLRLIGHHCGIRDQQRIDWAAIEPQPPERARRQEQVLVVEHRAAADCAGMRVDLVVDEVHHATMRQFGLVGEAHRHRISDIAR